MKIVVTGTRGIPDIQGGVETHCENLYPRLAAMGHDVTVIRRSCYINDSNRVSEYKGVKLVDVYAPRKKSFEAILHTALAVIKARMMNPDILHIHAVGPSLMAPFARMLGLKVVMTNHGPDYDRQKWGKLAKSILRAGEKWGTGWSNGVIVISSVISRILKDNYGREDVNLIYNGVDKPEKSTSTDFLDSMGIIPHKYILALGRFVKEKGFHDLIDAYSRLKRKDFQLVIAGDADHPDPYSTELKRKAAEAGVILTGFIKGEKLNQLLSNAALFVLPSYHEGLPIALLEAMSYDLDVIVSDIPANKLAELNRDDFFKAGDIEALIEAIERKIESSHPRKYDLSAYNWEHIARQTENVYKSVLEH